MREEPEGYHRPAFAVPQLFDDLQKMLGVSGAAGVDDDQFPAARLDNASEAVVHYIAARAERAEEWTFGIVRHLIEDPVEGQVVPPSVGDRNVRVEGEWNIGLVEKIAAEDLFDKGVGGHDGADAAVVDQSVGGVVWRLLRGGKPESGQIKAAAFGERDPLPDPVARSLFRRICRPRRPADDYLGRAGREVVGHCLDFLPGHDPYIF